MKTEECNDQPELGIFSDGFGYTPVNAMSVEFADSASYYLNYNKGEFGAGADDIVVHAATTAIEQMREALTWVTGEIAEADFHFDLMLEDADVFWAGCKKISNPPKYAFIIYVSLGCIPVLVGITNRLLHMQKAGPIILAMEIQGDGPIDKWHPELNPVGRLMYDYVNLRNTSTTTADAIGLIFFHEIAHATRGHFWIDQNLEVNSLDHRRAMESDADWSAGYLFMKYELHKLGAENYNNQEALTEIIDRLAVASASLNFALQINDGNSGGSYHLPHTRTLDNFFGAETAWQELKLPYSFVDLINEAYGQLALVDKVVAARLDQWITRDDPRNLEDEAKKKTVTEPIVRGFHQQAVQLERGPVKGARVIWDAIVYPKPTYRPQFHLPSSIVQRRDG